MSSFQYKITSHVTRQEKWSEETKHTSELELRYKTDFRNIKQGILKNYDNYVNDFNGKCRQHERTDE